MKHLAQIQVEFLQKQAAKWDDLSYDAQREYLHKHPQSVKRITKRPEERGKSYDEIRMSLFKKFVNKKYPDYKDMFDEDKNRVKQEFNKRLDQMLKGGLSKEDKKQIKKELPVVKNLSYEGQQEYKQKFPKTTKKLTAEPGDTGLSFVNLKEEVFKKWSEEKEFVNLETKARSTFNELPESQQQKIKEQFDLNLDRILPEETKLPNEQRLLTERKVKRLGESIAKDLGEKLNSDTVYNAAKNAIDSDTKLKKFFADKDINEDRMPDAFADYIKTSKKPEKQSVRKLIRQMYEDAKKDNDTQVDPDWKDMLDEDKDATIAEYLQDRYGYTEEFWNKNKERLEKTVKKIRKMHDDNLTTDENTDTDKQKTVKIDESKAKRLLKLFNNLTTEDGEMIHDLESVKSSSKPLFIENTNIEIKYDDGKYSVIGSRKDIKELKSKIKKLRREKREEREKEESKKLKDIPNNFSDSIPETYSNFKAKKISRDSYKFLWTMNTAKDFEKKNGERTIKEWLNGTDVSLEEPILDTIKKHKLYNQNLNIELTRKAEKDAVKNSPIYFLTLTVKVDIPNQNEEIETEEADYEGKQLDYNTIADIIANDERMLNAMGRAEVTQEDMDNNTDKFYEFMTNNLRRLKRRYNFNANENQLKRDFYLTKED